jgi:hypothetical protein
MPKKKNKPTKEKRLRVWVDPDNVTEIRTEIARNGRTIQGETNCILRDYYASKWDVPPASAGADALRRF